MEETTLPPFLLFYHMPDFSFILMCRAKGISTKSPLAVSILHAVFERINMMYVCICPINTEQICFFLTEELHFDTKD